MVRKVDIFVATIDDELRPAFLMRLGGRCCCSLSFEELVEVRRFGRFGPIVRWEHPLCGGALLPGQYTPPPRTWDEHVAQAVKLREIQAGRQAGGPPDVVEMLLKRWYSMRGGC